MSLPQRIAIDGPAASGKSTLAERLAKALGYLYFDTGVMYRAVTWAALQRGYAVEDADKLTELAANLDIDVRPPSVDDGRKYDVLVNGQDVTWAIRTPEVDANVSMVAAHPGVRAALTDKQRAIGRRGKVVMVGRDIGTVVMPDAELKIYLDASPEERARRRYQERLARGEQADYEQILAAVRARDRLDKGREIAPLRAADDAVILNSDGLSIGEVFEEALRLVKARDC
ncbi:MAG TPA: (d)CMP kinase [Chloroflexi bacterium]|nr:(d)CMP kinase [Chloroflexota bacterium]